MDEKLKYFFELHKEQCEAFKKQDPETSDFDVVFDIDGKKLYAHKFKLTTKSNKFDVMLAGTTPNEPIVIDDFSFNDFKDFITFIYSGACSFTEGNIFVMVDMAEFYNVKVFKAACEEFIKVILSVPIVHRVLVAATKYAMDDLFLYCIGFLFKTEFTTENIYQISEVAYHHSLDNLKKNVHDFIKKNFLAFIQAEQFQRLAVNIMKDVVECNQNTERQEELFEMVYKWAAKRVMEKEGTVANFNEKIKEELNAFLPFIKFQLMSYEFLIKSVVIDANGKMMKGILNCPDIDKIYNVIQSFKNISKKYNFWLTKQQKPSTSSSIIKNDAIEYYLVYDNDGDLAIKHRTQIGGMDYLLAEMFAETGFEFGNIKIV